MSSKPLIKQSLFLLNIFGFDYMKSNTLSAARSVVCTLLLTISFINSSLECIFRFDGLNSIEAIAGAIGFYQLIIKISAITIHRNSLNKLLSKVEKFWCLENFDLEIRNEIEDIYKIANKMANFVFIIIMLALGGYTVQTFFTETRKLYFQSYFPQDLNLTPDFEISLSLQTLSLFIGSALLLGFDGLFISLIINFICELKLLQHRYENVRINPKHKQDSKDTLTYLYEMIDHHNLILGCIKIMKNIYSLVLLNVYLFNMACICAGLLGVIASGLPPTLQSISTYGMFAIFYTMQLYYYCLCGNYLTNECQNVSMAVYNTKWWIKTQPELRKTYILILLRSNKIEELTAGGMFSLSLNSFTKVLRTALSFFTLVNAVYEDDVEYNIYY